MVVSLFSMWLSSFPSTIYWTDCAFLLCILWALLSKVNWLFMHGFISGCSVLFHGSTYLFLCQCRAVLIIIALLDTLKSRSMIPPALLFFFTIALAIRCLLWFYTNLGLFLLFCGKRHWNFDMGCFESFSLGSMAILKILILPVHEHEYLYIYLYL